MSVTFWAPGPAFGEMNLATGEMNLANANARLCLQVLGLDDEDLCGEIKPDHLPQILRKIVLILNNPNYFLPTRKDSVDKNFMDCGCDSDKIRNYLQRFQAICIEAKKANDSVVWG